MTNVLGHFLLALVTGAVGLLGAPAAPHTADAARVEQASRTSTAADQDVSVVELDLSGVAAGELQDLPDTAPLPAEEAGAGDGAEPPITDPSPAATPGTVASDATFAAFRTARSSAGDGTGTTTEPVLPENPPQPDILTTELETAPFSVLGVTWEPRPETGDVVIRYRVRQAGAWSEWEAVGSSDLAADADGKEAASDSTRGATDPIVAIDADGVQIWAEAAQGTVTGLKAVLVDPGEGLDDSIAQTGTAATGGAAPVAPAVLKTVGMPQPTIISRAQWGADESLRTCDPDYSSSMVSSAVHHTASTNAYTADQVPGLLRGFYAYHTRPESAGGRGWCDIGYNFLVDRFGRVFEGRGGGIDKPVIGVHTGGFNSRTIGVAAIGDFSTAAAPAQMVESISQLIAWKFSVHRILAGSNVTMTSGGGASKYPAGTVVQFPTIYGHRDAQQTGCPGQVLYNNLSLIRLRVAQLSNSGVASSPYGNWERTSSTSTAITVTGWMLDPNSSQPIQVVVQVNGVATTVTADGARPDVDAAVATAGPRHGYSITVPARGVRNVVCVSSRNTGPGYDHTAGCRVVTVVNASPRGQVDGVSATTNGIRIGGWALDPDTVNPINVAIYVDGRGYWTTANLNRPDVAAAFPGMGAQHGYTLNVTARSGNHQVCVVAVDSGVGPNTSLGCRTVSVRNAAPIGQIEQARGTATSITISGWALDRDTTNPINVAIYVDGRGYWTTANLNRPDVAAAFPGAGAQHGYTLTVPAGSGNHQVCVVAVDNAVDPNVSLGCRTVSVRNAAPIGQIEQARGTGTSISIIGWALDRDTTNPINVAIYVDGRGYWTTASLSRPDVAAAFPGAGAQHGYALTVPAGSGNHQVCVVAVDHAGGANTSLGCRTAST